MFSNVEYKLDKARLSLAQFENSLSASIPESEDYLNVMSGLRYMLK